MHKRTFRSPLICVFLVSLAFVVAPCRSEALHTLPVVGQDGGACSAVAMQGNYAFICEGQALRVVDVSNPASPSPLGQLVFNRVFHDIVVKGGYAYVALGADGLGVVDITNPLAPVLVGTGTFGESEECLHVAVSGKYVYAVGYASVVGREILHVVDVKDPSEPSDVGTFSVLIATKPVGIAVSGTWVFLTNESSRSVMIVDASNPTAPAYAGEWLAGIDDFATECVVGPNNYVYVAGMMNLYSVDISGQPYVTTAQSAPGPGGMRLSVRGNNLYASTTSPSTLTILDISSPATPTSAGAISIPQAGKDVATAVTSGGAVACVADGIGGLQVVNVSTPTSLTVAPYIGVMPKQTANSISYWQPRLVSVSGTHACVIDSDKGLVVYDISDPAHPQLKSVYSTNKEQMVSVFLDGDVAYVSEYANGLHTISIASPESPVELDALATVPANAGQLCVSEGYVYLATSEGVYVVDAQNPASLQQVTTIGSTFVYSLTVKGNTLFFEAEDLTSSTITYMYNIATPSSPSYLDESSPYDYPCSDLAVANARLYGARQMTNTVDVFDVNFGQGTFTYQSSLTPSGLSAASGLAASSDAVFVTDTANTGVLSSNGALVLDATSSYDTIGAILPERHVSSLTVLGDKCYAAGVDSGFTILGEALPAATVDFVPPFIHAIERYVTVTGTAALGALVSISGGRFPVVQQLGPDTSSFSLKVPLWDTSSNLLSIKTLMDDGLIGAPVVRRVVEGIDYPETPQEVVELIVSPSDASVALNDNLQFMCTAMFADLSTADVTPYVMWRDIANDEEITANGLYTNSRTGSALIRASLGPVKSNGVYVTDQIGRKATGNIRATVQLMGTTSGSSSATLKLNTMADWSGTTVTLAPAVSLASGQNKTSNTGSWNATQGNYYFKAESSNTSYITQSTNRLTLGSTLPSGYNPLSFVLISGTAGPPVVQFVQPTSSTTTDKSSALPLKVVLASVGSYLKSASYTITKTVGATTTTLVSSTNISIPAQANSCLFSTTLTLGSGTTNGTVFKISVTALNYNTSSNTTTTTYSLTYTGTKSGTLETKTLPLNAVDSDGDGLPDWLEYLLGTQISSVDTDSDGVWDGDEYYLYGTDPTVSDSNGDGISDGADVASGRDPRLDNRVRMRVVAPADGATVYGNDVRLVARALTERISRVATVDFEMKGPSTSYAWVAIGVSTTSPFVASLNTTLLTPGTYTLRARATTLLGLVDLTPIETTITVAPLASIRETTLLGIHELTIPVSNTEDNTIIFSLEGGAVLTMTLPAGAVTDAGTTLTLRSPADLLSAILSPLQLLTDINFSASLSNAQSVLGEPATLSIAYPDPAHDGTLNGGAPGELLAIEHLGILNMFERLPLLGNDVVSAHLSVLTPHLSTFAVVVEGSEPPLAIGSSGVLPAARLGEFYSVELSASGGTSPYTWAQTVGTLPPGLALVGNMITGTPSSEPGPYHFGVSVSDTSSPTGTASANYTIHVASDVASLPVSISEPSVTETASGPVDFVVTYTGADYITLSAADVTLETTGTVTGEITVTGTGTTSRTVTVSNIHGEGTFSILLSEGTASTLDDVLAEAAGPSSAVTVVPGIDMPFSVWSQLLTIVTLGTVVFMMRSRKATR